MKQKCAICGEKKEFRSALVIVSTRRSNQFIKQQNVTKPIPVCKTCRKTAPLSSIYAKGPQYLV